MAKELRKTRTVHEPKVAAALARLRRPLRLTWAGLWVERLTRAFWPLASVVFVTLGLLMLNAHRAPLPAQAIWAALGALGLAGVFALIWGARRLVLPQRAEALDRLDRQLPGRPIAALGDHQAIGAGDAASRMVWRAHIARMTTAVADARAVPPDPKLAPRDPYGLRLMAMTVFLVALVFGSLGRVGTVTQIAPGGPANALAAGPSWEGWVEPPAYTGLPALYLADLDAGTLTLAQGTRITLRLYGEVGAINVTETVSGLPPTDSDPGSDALPLTAIEFEVAQAGAVTISGASGRVWDVVLTPDTPPVVELLGEMQWAAEGEMRQAFRASDDYGVNAGEARISIDLEALDRRYGLALPPEPRDAIVLDLPLPFTGDRREFDEELADNLSEHPWARLPVTVEFVVWDARDQIGRSDPVQVILPGRRFFDPLAKAVIDLRRDILWTRANAARAAQILRAVTHRPDGFLRKEVTYLKIRTLARRMESAVANDIFDAAKRDDVAGALWDIALELEFGDLADARERLSRAQDRLSEAMENGASDQEIAALIEELRRAMEDYMRQLAEQQAEDGTQNQQAENQQMQEMTGDQLQEMLERLQELMEEGRMAEAADLMEQLRQMMENMQVTQGPGQNGQQSPGEQAMEDLADTLREQQGLSDEAFRDLQEQFNRDAQTGENQGNTGRNGGQGRGQQHNQGQSGQGQQGGEQGGQQGQPGQPGDPSQGGQDGGPSAQGLADRQEALRRELQRQEGNLPGAGTEAGDAARDALGRAGEAMDRAEDDIRQNELADALDNQAEAIEALREGMRNLGEAMAQQQQSNGQGQQLSDSDPAGQADPLGREQGAQGRMGTDENLLQGDDVYRRARDLLDEIRRRSGDQSRPDAELDYLKRLLDRF